MRKFQLSLLSLVIVVFASRVHGEDISKPETAKPFTLQDQYEKDHTLKFPRRKPLVISVADPGGAKDAPIWTDNIKSKYGNRIDFWSMANLSFIPEVGHGAARIGIKATSKESVLCDWDGAVSLALKAKKGQANIIVITRSGVILHRVSGTATEGKLQQTHEAISNALEAANEETETETR